MELTNPAGARVPRETEVRPYLGELTAAWQVTNEISQFTIVTQNFRVFWAHVECPECHEFSGIKAVAPVGSLSGLFEPHMKASDAGHIVTVLLQYPEPDYDMPKEVPSELAEVLKELKEDLQRGRNRARILAGCRSLLDRALLDLDGGTKNKSRVERIEQLATNGRLTADIAAWAKKLWVEGHDGIHELRDPGHPIEEHVAFLKLFFEVVFVMPARVSLAQGPKP